MCAVFVRAGLDGFVVWGFYVFFFKQKTAYEMVRSDWSSDVCSSDLCAWHSDVHEQPEGQAHRVPPAGQIGRASCRERVFRTVQISVVAGSLKKKKTNREKEKPSPCYYLADAKKQNTW